MLHLHIDGSFDGPVTCKIWSRSAVEVFGLSHRVKDSRSLPSTLPGQGNRDTAEVPKGFFNPPESLDTREASAQSHRSL